MVSAGRVGWDGFGGRRTRMGSGRLHLSLDVGMVERERWRERKKEKQEEKEGGYGCCAMDVPNRTATDPEWSKKQYADKGRCAVSGGMTGESKSTEKQAITFFFFARLLFQ
jgi:hypothetical protein